MINAVAKQRISSDVAEMLLREMHGPYKAANVDVYDSVNFASKILGATCDSYSASDLVALTGLILDRLDKIESSKRAKMAG